MALTKAELQQEIMKCGRNPQHFICNYCKIQHPKRGKIPFALYDFQKKVIDDFRREEYIVIVKSRQVGMSTVTAAYITWMMLFQPDRNIVVIATKAESAKNMVKKVRIMYENLPAWMKISGIKTDNKNSFELMNGSIFKATSTSADAGRSEAVSLLVIDEAAHIENMEEIWASIYPTLSQGGGGKSIGARCIALSSPLGIGTWFHKTYVDAESGANEFFPINLPWNVHPERDDNWFENEKKNFSAKEIAQEYLCSFLGSGDTVIDTKDIEWVKSKVKEPLYKTGPEANVWVWEQYHENATYFMTCDVAKGDGGDFSTFHILNVNSCEVVCEFQGKIYTDKFAELIQKTATVYGKCSVVIESNGPGLAVLSHLKTIGYKNIYCRSKSSNKPVDASYLGIDSDIEAGFNTTHQTRPLVVSKFEEYIRNKQIIFRSSRLAHELDTFVWKAGGKPEAQRGSNDDLVMAAAIMSWIKDTVYTSFNQDSFIKQKMLTSIFTSRRPFSTQIPGVPKPAPMIIPENPYDSKPYRGLLSIYKG